SVVENRKPTTDNASADTQRRRLLIGTGRQAAALSRVGILWPAPGLRGCRRLTAGVKASRCLLSVVGCRLPVAGCRLPVFGCRLSVVSCQLPVVICRSSTTDH